MLKNIINILFLLSLSACQYQFGNSSQVLSGLYRINKVTNETSYRLVDNQLRTSLIKIIQRNKETKIGSEEMADNVISVIIKNISKVDKEVDPVTGYVTEAQFIITAEFTLKNKNVEKSYKVLNTNHKNSSGIYRPPINSGDSSKEQQNLNEALTDLAEAIFTSMSGKW
jgi:outer membrane lipopolysaccharide assembly protein LptE/RlpB